MTIRGQASPEIEYIRKVFAPEDAGLRRAAESTPEELRMMKIGAEEGRLLQFLARLVQARRIVEVGTLTGYSAIWLARALPADGHLWTVDKTPLHVRLARENIAASDVADRVSVVEGDALKALETLNSHGPFDMVFIDADKIQYEDYLNWAEKHVRKGGLIVGDNTFLFGAVYSQKLPENVRESAAAAMRNFNSRLANYEKYNSIMIPTAQGLTIAQKLY